jgi:hypothetical protein
MTATPDTLRAVPQAEHVNEALDGKTNRLFPAGGQGRGGPRLSPAISRTLAAGRDQSSPIGSGRGRVVRSWPLLVLALPAAVAVWSGWVRIGQMTGFGQVHPLPGIWDSLHVNTAVTLPVGVEAYAAYALRAWLSASDNVSVRTRRFARWSAIGSLLLGMAGQVAYHLLAQAGTAHAPWGITTAVSCLPVLVLGMGAALAHLLRADGDGASRPGQVDPSPGPDHMVARADRGDGDRDQDRGTAWRKRLAEAETTATRLSVAGQRVSRRTLRAAGLRGSNADLGVLARIARSRATNVAALVDQG